MSWFDDVERSLADLSPEDWKAVGIAVVLFLVAVAGLTLLLHQVLN